jgi:hypothetical protein
MFMTLALHLSRQSLGRLAWRGHPRPTNWLDAHLAGSPKFIKAQGYIDISAVTDKDIYIDLDIDIDI